MENYFVIRTYGFAELAQMYNPHITKNSASYRLKCWINNCPELLHKLQLKPYTRILNPSQVKLIINHFDLPESYVEND